jgi:hypothetical protein
MDCIQRSWVERREEEKRREWLWEERTREKNKKRKED